jgi:DMSO/TMAO reductase YedYZ molybdopterin-dependent catalytic subunit
MATRDLEGEWVQGWPDRRRLVPHLRKDHQGRVIYARTPFFDLQTPITPTDLRYIVAQLQMPEPVLPHEWSLSVDGLVERPLRLGFDEVQRLPATTVRVVTECSGTDANFFDWERSGGQTHSCDRCPPQPGKPSRYDLNQPHTGQVSSGEFTGVRLSTLLKIAGLKPAALGVRAEGFDRGRPGERVTQGATGVPEELNYDKCLPLEKALDPDTILAWGLNGEYLRHVHGAPLRLVVPGWSGNWSVKWLQRLEVLDHIAPCFYQTQYFVYVDNPDDADREPVTTMGVRCIITDPRDGDLPLGAGPNTVRGLAWSGCGAITEVEVSTDGGATWAAAHLEGPREKWLWTRWSYAWDAAPGAYKLMARARDEAGRQQPQVRWNYQRKNYDGIVPVDVEVS